MRLTDDECRFYQNLADRYRLATKAVEFNPADAIEWAIDREELETPPKLIKAYHRQRLAEALRSRTKRHVTKAGEVLTVRLEHSLRVTEKGDDGKPVQKDLWASVYDAPDDFKRRALFQRLRGVRVDIKQLKADLAFFNEQLLEAGRPPIQMSFDFSGDDESLDHAG